jgi:hypothetical protein
MYRCWECKGGELFCGDCCVLWHLANPLHIIEVSVNELLDIALLIIGFEGLDGGAVCEDNTTGHRHDNSIWASAGGILRESHPRMQGICGDPRNLDSGGQRELLQL